MPRTILALVVIFFGCEILPAENLPWTHDLTDGVRIEFVPIASGEFSMGSPQGEISRGQDEEQHSVTLTEGFTISRSAITRAQWEIFIRETGYRTEAEVGDSGGFGWDGKAQVQRKEFTWRNPGFPQTGDHPVCIVTFPDADKFCQWLERKTSRKISLPTEAQWEYACRGGTDSAWHPGLGPSGNFAIHKRTSGNGTRPVQDTPVNPFGLIIGGNVAEWCLDWYAPYPGGSQVNPLQTNPNLSDKPRRVLRGGSWARDPSNTRSAARFRSDPRSRNSDIGFRVVSTGEPKAPPAPTPAASAPGQPTQDITLGNQIPDFPSQQGEDSPVIEQKSPLPGVVSFVIKLLFFFAVVFVLRKFLTKLKNLGSSSTTPPPLANNRAATPPARRPSNPTPVVKITNDGFWFTLNIPPGEWVVYQYELPGQPPVKDRVSYQPSSSGHFIFTRDKPNKVSVAREGKQDESDHLSLIPPLMMSNTPSHIDTSHSRGFSAY